MTNHQRYFPQNRLKRKEIERRAARIKLVLTDCDGVLTDTGVYYSEWGEALKRFSIRDGMAVAILRDHGVDTGILSGEESPSIRRRAEKLDLKHVYLGAKDKMQYLEVVKQLSGLSLDEVAYIGDDVNDLGVIRALGQKSLIAAPRDAVYAVHSEVQYICQAKGGNGAFREFAEWILLHRRAACETEADGSAKEVSESHSTTFSEEER